MFVVRSPGHRSQLLYSPLVTRYSPPQVDTKQIAFRATVAKALRIGCLIQFCKSNSTCFGDESAPGRIQAHAIRLIGPNKSQWLQLALAWSTCLKHLKHHQELQNECFFHLCCNWVADCIQHWLVLAHAENANPADRIVESCQAITRIFISRLDQQHIHSESFGHIFAGATWFCTRFFDGILHYRYYQCLNCWPVFCQEILRQTWKAFQDTWVNVILSRSARGRPVTVTWSCIVASRTILIRDSLLESGVFSCSNKCSRVVFILNLFHAMDIASEVSSRTGPRPHTFKGPPPKKNKNAKPCLGDRLSRPIQKILLGAFLLHCMVRMQKSI